MTTIYKIWSEKGEKVYIGSTTMSLTERLRCHRKDENPGTSRILLDEYGVENCQIESLEEVKEEERYIRERHWVENTPNVVNERIPGRIGNERYIASYEKHREKRLAKQKAYKQANKERIAAHCAQRVICPICSIELAKQSLLRHTKRKH